MGPSRDAIDRLGLTRVLERGGLIGDYGGDVALPPDDVADSLMTGCGIGATDRAAALDARPDPVRHPELWWLLTGYVDELRRTRDAPVPAAGFGAWPAVPPETGAAGRHLYLWALLTAVEPLRALHAARGVPTAVTDATLSLAPLMAEHRRLTGRSGIGLLDLWSPPVQFRGADLRLGRHSFTRAEACLGDGVAARVLMVHVPPTGPLDPVASGESFAAAGGFFPRHFPDEPVAGFVCVSWLMDPQLGEYLPAESNILRFQRRFHVLPLLHGDDGGDGDRELALGLNLTLPPGPLTEDAVAGLPRHSTLERAFADHLRSGRHWHIRTGIRAFELG